VIAALPEEDTQRYPRGVPPPAVDLGTTHTVAVDLDTGAETWSLPVDWAFEETWYTTADGLVFGRRIVDALGTPRLPDFSGAPVAEAEDGEVDLSLQARAVRDGLAVAHFVEYDDEEETTVHCLYAADVATGERTALYPLGHEAPEQLALAGSTVAVLNPDGTVLVLDAAALR
jgi:molecular chaperone HscA